MGRSVPATSRGTLAGVAAFIGVVVANGALGMFGLAFLRDGGGGLNLVWAGVLPCLVAAVVAARRSGTAVPSLLPGVAVGTGGGVLASWGVFHLLAGMQGCNPLIFAGPFCAAAVAAGLSDRVRATHATPRPIQRARVCGRRGSRMRRSAPRSTRPRDS